MVLYYCDGCNKRRLKEDYKRDPLCPECRGKVIATCFFCEKEDLTSNMIIAGNRIRYDDKHLYLVHESCMIKQNKVNERKRLMEDYNDY